MLSDSFCGGTPTDDEGHSSGLSCVCPQGCGRQLKTNDVADADRVGIVTATMGSGDVFWTGGLDGAVDGDDVVIAAACPTEGSVVTVDVCHPQFAACLVGGAMNDNKGDLSHKYNFFVLERKFPGIDRKLKKMRAGWQ